MQRRHLRFIPLFASLIAMLTLAAPGYGSLNTPTGLGTDSGVTVPAFKWNPVSGAASYIFELDAGSSLGTPLVSVQTKNTEVTLPPAQSGGYPNGPYTWHVRAVDASNANGPWSAPASWNKTGTGPTLLSPANTSTVTYPAPVVLKWAPVDGATKYTVALSNASNMTNADTTTTDGTSYAPLTWLAPGTHYWTVTAKDVHGNSIGTSPASGSAMFTWAWPSTVTGLSINNAIDPSAGATAQWTMFDPKFTWNPVSGASGYQVEVNTDSVTWSASSKVCCSDTIATTLTPKTLLPNATYWWRVRAVDPAGTPGQWTVGQSFTQSFDSFITAPASTPSIANLHMADNLGDIGTDVDGGTVGYQTQVPIVKWDPVPGASAYDVLMVQYVSGQCQWTTSGVPRWTTRTAATSFTPLASGWNNLAPWPANGVGVSTDTYDLQAGMSYCVRVTPFRDQANTGSGFADVSGDPTFLNANNDESTPAFTFTTMPTGNACTAPCNNGYLGAADYVAPLTGSTTGAVPLFTWNPVAGANGYFVIVAHDPAFSNIVDYAFTHIPAYAPRAGGSPRTYQTNNNSHFYWVVLPASGVDGSGAATLPNSGHPQSFDLPHTGPSLLAPADQATVTGVPTFSWDPIDGARQYELYVSTDPNFGGANGTVDEDITTSNTTFTSQDVAYPSDQDVYWEVRALDFNNHAQPWSDVRVYSQTWPTPDLTGVPSPSSTDVEPNFSWNAVQGALSYTFEFEQPGDSQFTDTTVNTTTWTRTSPFNLGDIKWRVFANFGKLHGSSTDGPTTGDQIFTRSIAAPTGEATIAPSGTGSAPVLLTWNWQPGAATYSVELSSDPSFATSLPADTTETNSYAPTLMPSSQESQLLAGGTWYWRVAAVDTSGKTGPYSTAKPLVFATRLAATASTTVMGSKTTQTIKITVKDGQGHSVRGAKVTVSGAGVKKTSKTNKTGNTFSFKVHPTKKGTITFSASKSGCAGGKVQVVVF